MELNIEIISRSHFFFWNNIDKISVNLAGWFVKLDGPESTRGS
jgi:hypothetical protein